MLKRILPVTVVLAVALWPTMAAGQLYKSTMPDGRVIYSDKPQPGAVKSEKKQLDTSKRGVEPPSTGEKAALKQLEGDRRARESAEDRVRRAEIALHDAEVAQQMGKEAQPNERQGTAGGGSRLTDGYWERQKKLEEAVTNARRTLDQVRTGK